MTRRIANYALFFIFFSQVALAREALAKDKLIFYYARGCHECVKIKEELLPKIREEFKSSLEMEYRDIADIENYKSLLALEKQYGLSREVKVPAVFFAGNFLIGRQEISRQLEILLRENLGRNITQKQSVASFDLVRYFLSFTPLAVTSAGLIDGINPCAFTVIVFFISFLALQGYRKKELIVIGLFFILAVFLTYLLIGLGLFGFFYALKGVWLARKIVNLTIGIFTIILGILAVSDFLKYKKTGQTEGMNLQLPQAIKNRIHSVIAGHYRKPGDINSGVAARAVFSLVLTACITGFLVSILEAVCTGQTYLPTISFILKTTPIKLAALGYLLLYNLMFILPLFVIFLLSLLGVTSGQFSRFLQKHFLATKVLMALLFFGLGIFLVWRG
jgi:cytochrome c biogenesis protein CcdA/glutaredoxin